MIWLVLHTAYCPLSGMPWIRIDKTSETEQTPKSPIFKISVTTGSISYNAGNAAVHLYSQSQNFKNHSWQQLVIPHKIRIYYAFLAVAKNLPRHKNS